MSYSSIQFLELFVKKVFERKIGKIAICFISRDVVRMVDNFGQMG